MTRVAIVGGGIIGLAIADELTRRNVEVDLFEREGEVGTQASWAAAGILSPLSEVSGPGPFFTLLLAATQFMPEAVARLQALTSLDLQFRASGMLALAFSDADEKEFERQFSWQKEIDFPVERVTADQVKSWEPAIDGAFRWALWWPQTAQVNNRRMVEAYRLLLQRQGCRLHPATPVRRFLIEKERTVGVETTEGRWEADWVVNCAGSWAGFDLSCPFEIPTLPVKGQILQLRTSRSLVHRIVESPRAYLVQRTDQQLIVGTTVERIGFDTEVTPAGRQSILQGAREISSALAAAPIETVWAGLRPGTPDHLPILGPTPVKQFLLATGHYRNGILLAPLTGRLIADLVTGGSGSFDLSPFSINRFLTKLANEL